MSKEYTYNKILRKCYLLDLKVIRIIFLSYRYGYNQETKKCEEFNYGGCKGNENSFITHTECANNCEEGSKLSSRDMCLKPRDAGPCKDRLPKWYDMHPRVNGI